MGDYLTYFFNIPGLNPMTLLTLFLLLLFRLAPIVVIPPFFGGKLLPGTVKIGVVIVLSIAFLPVVLNHSAHPPSLNLFFAVLALKEFVIGLLLALLVGIPFFFVQGAGVITDYLRGASVFQIQDPTLQNQASPVGMLYNFILIYMFYQIDGPFLFFDAIVKSFKLVPPEQFINPIVFSLKGPLFKAVVQTLHFVVSIAIQLAAPAIVSILMTEMFLGIANRLAPQVQIAFLGLSLKSLVGLTLIWIGFFFLMKQFTAETMKWLKLIDKLIGYF